MKTIQKLLLVALLIAIFAVGIVDAFGTVPASDVTDQQTTLLPRSKPYSPFVRQFSF